MKKIPLYNKHGDVVARTMVDDADYAVLAEYRWRLDRAPRTNYAMRGIRRGTKNGKLGRYFRVQMHRVILGLSAKDKRLSDHRNGNGLDNRRANLRICTKTENVRNARLSLANTSGYKGVFQNKNPNRWYAHIRVNTKLIHLGGYDTARKAYAAYKDAAKRLHGELANVG